MIGLFRSMLPYIVDTVLERTTPVLLTEDGAPVPSLYGSKCLLDECVLSLLSITAGDGELMDPFRAEADGLSLPIVSLRFSVDAVEELLLSERLGASSMKGISCSLSTVKDFPSEMDRFLEVSVGLVVFPTEILKLAVITPDVPTKGELSRLSDNSSPLDCNMLSEELLEE